MPRANRIVCAGLVWHITQRCHQKDFLLKFSRDRNRWQHWLFQAKKRFRLCVLNYIVTRNHVHLLVYDDGRGEIAASMQLVSGRVAQEYNKRKTRHGAFWEDRYHATAVQTGAHLFRCMVYIDLNMVRAGVVQHPQQWRHSGYHETCLPPARKQRLDLNAVTELLGYSSIEELTREREAAILQSLQKGDFRRDKKWTESVAVGDKQFVATTKKRLGQAARFRELIRLEDDGDWCLKEPVIAYGP